MPYGINYTPASVAELALACLLLLLAFSRVDTGRWIFAQAMLMARQLERRPTLMIVLAGLIPVIIRVALLPIVPSPQPYIMEEYNHLFLADTYMLGRVANPVHPLAVMIQTYQQIEWPSYASARPPLPPIFLFIGKAVFGSPFAGSLLALGLTSAALCWALQGWMAGRWAALGSFLAIVTFCLFGYWINSYWAPTTIVLGGALLFGAVPRIEREPRLVWALVCIVALALLAGTRPFENAVFAAVIFGWLAVRFLMADRRAKLGAAILRVVIPLAAGTSVIVAAQLWYNEATTGNPLVMPYQIWRVSQDMTPNFLWQPFAAPPTFYHPGAARFAEWNQQIARLVKDGGLQGTAYLFSRHAITFRDLLGPFLFLAFACWSPRWGGTWSSGPRLPMWRVGLYVVLTLLTLNGPWAGSAIKLLVLFILFKRWANPVDRLPVLLILAGMIATSMPTFYMNIYVAAYTAPLLMLVAGGLANISRWQGRQGRSLAGFLLLGAALVPVGQTVNAGLNNAGTGIKPYGPVLSHFDLHFLSPRAQVIEQLAREPGRHVVFVQPVGDVPDAIDPVWNAPNIDAQKFVFLRRLRPEWTATARQYYAGRRFWLMQLDEMGDFKLAPYPDNEQAAAVPLESLPNPDRLPAESIGAQRLRN